MRKALFTMITILLGTSSWAGGVSYFNLPWFLKDVVATTLTGREAYEELRSLGVAETEFLLRESAELTDVWVVKQTNIGQVIDDIGCDAFMVRTFSDWQRDIAQNTNSVPQWREAFHGVSIITDYRTGYNGLRQVKLVAAVRSPGIPLDAFLQDGSGGLLNEYFEAAGTFRGAGFHLMLEAVSPLTMTLSRTESCNGFELYVWEFRR